MSEKSQASENRALDQILEKCAKLMATKGYHGTSMRDLALTTGRSLSGIYHHFNSKEELLFLINHRGFGHLVTTSQHIMAEQLSPEKRLRKLIESHIKFFSLHQSEMKVMMFGTQQMDKSRSQEISVLKHQYSDNFKMAVSDLVCQISDKKISKTALDRKSYLLFGMMNWVFGWYSTDEHGSVEQLINDIFTTFTKGCVPPE